MIWAGSTALGAYHRGRSIETIAGPVGLALLVLVVLGGLAPWPSVRRHETRLRCEAGPAIPGPPA